MACQNSRPKKRVVPKSFQAMACQNTTPEKRVVPKSLQAMACQNTTPKKRVVPKSFQEDFDNLDLTEDMQDVVEMIKVLEQSKLWAGNFDATTCKSERRGEAGGEGFILDVSEVSQDPDEAEELEPLQLAIPLKLVTDFLSVSQDSKYNTFTASGCPTGMEAEKALDLLNHIEEQVNQVDGFNRSIPPKSLFLDISFTAIADAGELARIKADEPGKKLPFGQMFDARKVFDLNGAIPVSDPALFRGNPVVAFSPKVWKAKENFPTLRYEESKFANRLGWNVTFNMVAAYRQLRRFSTPKKVKRNNGAL